MMRSVYLKALYDKRWFTFGWTLGFMAFAALMAVFYPAMNQAGALDSLVANMPKAFEGLVGNLANLKEFPSYLGSQLFDIRLPIIAGIMAIILGLSLSTAEEESGELRTLTALSISRTKLLIQKWLALVTVMLITMFGLAAGIYAVIPFIDGATIEFTVILQLLLMTWLLMTAYGTVAFGAGMAFGNRGIANALSILVIIGSFLLSTFGQAVDWLEKFEKFSLIHYFPAVEIAKGSIELKDIGVLSAVIILVLTVAILVFRRRDIA